MLFKYLVSPIILSRISNMKWVSVVVLCHVCVAKCLAMSTRELDDFSNFLKETSQLDQSLKSNIPEDEVDYVSDNAWEESGKFEGDLILNERQRKMIVNVVAQGLARNGVSDTTKRWPENEVVYRIQEKHFTSGQIEAIQNAMTDLSGASCIKFRPFAEGDSAAVVIQGNRRGCFSQVGYQGGFQVLNLSRGHPVGRGCFRHGTIVHELLHTLGFFHTHSSTDRDDYIDIIWENIYERALHNFRKYDASSITDFGVGYDYDSVLHYSGRAFSTNGKPTLVPKQQGATIGQRIGLSDKDTQKLNKMYCDAGSDDLLQDELPIKKNKKTKKGKNKPFEGHGLGYEQGKAVVIKLPKAKTYEMQDSPQFTVFDYFSKTPQELHQALIQGTGDRQEVTDYGFSVIPNLEEYETSSYEDYPHHQYNSKEETATNPKNEDKRNFANTKHTHTHDNNNFGMMMAHILNPKKMYFTQIKDNESRELYGDTQQSPYDDDTMYRSRYVPKLSYSLDDKERQRSIYGHRSPRYRHDEYVHKYYPTLF